MLNVGRSGERRKKIDKTKTTMLSTFCGKTPKDKTSNKIREMTVVESIKEFAR